MPSIFGKPETPAAQPERELIVKTKPATLQPSPVLNQSITAGVTGSFAVPSWDFSAIKVTKPTSDGSSVVTAFSNMSPMSQTLTKSLEHTPVTILSKPSPPTSVQKLEEPIERPQPPIATPSINGQQNAQSTKDAYSDAFNKYQYHSNATPVHTASKPPQITYKPQRPKTEKQLGGWLTKEERKAMAKRASDIGSDDNVASYDDGGFGTQADIDWNAPNQLVDWEGNILPAPVEWSSRHQCQRDNWASVMVEYIEKSQPHYVKQGDKAVSALIIDTSSKSFCSGAKGVENGEVAPKEWIANNIENQTLQSFWKSLMQTVLSPVDESDLQGAPFWQRYNDNTTILQPLKHEEAKCEPVEDDVSREYFLYKTGQTQTAELAIKKHNEKVNAKEREEINNRRMIKERCTAEKARFQEPPPPNPLRPAANFYLRPLSVSRDSAALHEIYTHYAANTFQAVDNAAVDLAAFCSELQALRATALPMIVAVERAPGAKHKSRFEATTRAPEKIIGYATTDQGSTSRKQMSHLGHMEIYVHPEYAHKGVGKNLLDRMLWLLDPTYRIQGDVSWKTPSNELSYTMPGGKRSVVAVRVAMFYGEGEKAKADWVGTWLEKFAFEKQADFSRAGMKMGQWYVSILLSKHHENVS
jgi:L-amino acid N-acyltransferase YncA